jgi:hemolysin activation/secretion protein
VSDGYFPSRLEGDPRAMLARGNVAGRLRGGNLSLLTLVQGQLSGKPLASFEEYSAGQYTIGRGYDPAAASGDSAFAARIEPSYVVRAGGAVIEPYAFGDAVRLWNHDGPGSSGHTLRSAGAGVRAYLGNSLKLDATWAHPFDGALPGAPRASDRFLISIGVNFTPGNR